MQLTAVYIAGTKVTDAGLKELAALKQLQSLNLRNTHVTAARVAECRRRCPSAGLRA